MKAAPRAEGLRAWARPFGTALMIAVGSLGTLSAQAPDPSAATPRVGCFRGEPRPTCASFWLVELQGSTALYAPTVEVQTPGGGYRVETSGSQFDLSLGHMANVHPRWAIGGTVSLGTGADDLFTGVRARARRWLTPDFSLELETGLARGHANHTWYPSKTGFSTGVRFNIQDYGSVFVRYDRYGAMDADSVFGPFEPRVTGPQHFVRGGVGLGSKAALVGTGAVAVGYGVLIALLLFSGGFS